MNVVIFSGCFYPMMNPRSFRTTELAKEFVRQGHHVIVYAPLGKYKYREDSNFNGIEVRNLGALKFGTINCDNISNRNILVRCFNHFFGKFIESPNIELYFLVRRRMKELIKSALYIDLLISIAVPYPIHWGLASIKKDKSFPLWISDCGDPYMGNSFKKNPFYFKYIEKAWCRKTDFITVPINSAKKAYYKEFQNKIKVIPQGFEMKSLDNIYKKNKILTFIFAGNVYPNLRDPHLFLDYLKILNIEFKFIVYTKTKKIFEEYKSCLKEKIIINDFIPRKELLNKLVQADFLVNFTNPSQIQSPSKLIDYAIVNRPIINISSEFKEMEIFKEFVKGIYTHKVEIEDVSQYNITNVAKQFLNLKNIK